MNTKLIQFLKSEIPTFDSKLSIIDQIDSLALMSLISRMEKYFKISFENNDLNFNTFSNLENLSELIKKKLNQT